MSYIYILTNPSLSGMVKVGMTAKHPQERADELHSTGVPTPYEVAAMWPVPLDELRSWEQKAHNALGKYRVARNREFFSIEADRAIKLLSVVIPSIEEIRVLQEREAQKRKRQAQLRERARQAEIQRDNATRRRQKEDRLAALERELGPKRARMAELEKILSSPERSMAVATSLVQRLLFLPLRYPWIVIPPVVFFLCKGDLTDRIVLALLAPLGVVIGGIFLFPVLAPIFVLFSLVSKVTGPTHEEARDELKALMQSTAPASREIAEVEQALRHLCNLA
jgi:hypothetical protein